MKLFLALFLLTFLAYPEEIRDKNHRLVGTITCYEKLCTARDANRQVRGYYRIKENRTYDSNWRFVAQGNVLSSLLWNFTSR
jgi:hypothetical protein